MMTWCDNGRFGFSTSMRDVAGKRYARDAELRFRLGDQTAIACCLSLDELRDLERFAKNARKSIEAGNKAEIRSRCDVGR